MRSSWLFLVGVVLAVAAWPAYANKGSETYNEFLESGAIYDDEAWQDYVTEVGERVLAVTPHRNRTYTFVILDDTNVNAFTMGDEYIFLTRGILAYFNTEDQLAAVIGHEIGHVVGKHVSNRKNRHVLTQVMGWLGVIATSSGALKDLADTLSAAAGADYGRKEELESDAYGAEWIIEAGYNPRAVVEAIQILRDNDLYETNVVGRPAQYHGIFRSHPEHQKRIHELNKIVGYEIPEEVRPPERDYLEMIDGLVFGEDGKAGVVKDTTYYHSSYRVVVTYPTGWQVSNSSAEVMGRSPNDVDAYVTMQRQQPPQKRQTPAEYISETLKRDDVENGQDIRVGEYPGHMADITVAGDSGKKRKIAVVFKGDQVYLFKGEVSERGDAEKFEEAFTSVVSSLRPMTAADQRVANNRRIEIIEARPGDTFAKLAQGSPIPRNGEELLRVINGKHPYGEPRAGDMIKVVR